MSLSSIITPAVLDKVISLLVPLFMTGGDGDLLTARHAASRLLAAYNVQSEEELRLAAEIIGFGFGALDALSQSMAPDLTLNAMLRLRGSANTQHRSANQCQRTLDKLRKERRIADAAPKVKPAPPELVPDDHLTAETLKLSDYSPVALNTNPATPQTARHDHPTAETPMVSDNAPAAPDISLSRQQRRAAARKSDKAQRKQVELARREAMRAARTPAYNPATVPHQPSRLTQPRPA